MTDTIATIGRSIVHHGPLNQRVYLMTLHPEDVPLIVAQLYELASMKGYSKILARISIAMEAVFKKAHYIKEATIPGYSVSGEDLLFMSRFLGETRSREYHPDRIAQNFTFIENDSGQNYGAGTGFPTIRQCGQSDCSEMALIYRQVFASYPFPVDDPDYLADTMASHTRYFCITENDRIVGLSGGEMDTDNLAVEMTDFAVVPEMRGRGLGAYLLAGMEQDMRSRGIRTAFTISRTLSPGMNLIFKRANYNWGGTLVNNTHISGGIESMWVWHKRLED